MLFEHRRLVQALAQPGDTVYGMIGEHDTADDWKIVPPFELVELKGTKLVVKLDPTDLLRDLDGNYSFQCYPWMAIVPTTYAIDGKVKTTRSVVKFQVEA